MHTELAYQAVAAVHGLCEAWRRLDDTRAEAQARRRAVESRDSRDDGETESEDRHMSGTAVLLDGFDAICVAIVRMTMALRDDLELHGRLQDLAHELFFGDNLTLQEGPWDVDEALSLCLTMFACSPLRFRVINVIRRTRELPDKSPFIAMGLSALLHGHPWLNESVVAELDDNAALGRAMVGRIGEVFAAQQMRVIPYVPDGMPGLNSTDEVTMATALHVVEVYARFAKASDPFARLLVERNVLAPLPAAIERLQRSQLSRSHPTLGVYFQLLELRRSVVGARSFDVSPRDLVLVLRQTRIATSRPQASAHAEFSWDLAGALQTLARMCEPGSAALTTICRCIAQSIAIAVDWVERNARSFSYDVVPDLEALAVALDVDPHMIACAQPGCAAKDVRLACSRCGWVVRRCFVQAPAESTALLSGLAPANSLGALGIAVGPTHPRSRSTA